MDKQGTELLAAIDTAVLPQSMGGTRNAEERLVTGSDGEQASPLMFPHTPQGCFCLRPGHQVMCLMEDVVVC